MAARSLNLFTTQKRVDSDSKHNVECIFVETKYNKTDNNTYNHCWWCRLPFFTQPIGCPLTLEDGVYYVDGLYCSPNCVKAYYLEYLQNDSKYKNSIKLLAMMMCEESEGDARPVTIEPSLPWRLLVQYGGTMTADKYRSLSKHAQLTYKSVKTSPVVTVYDKKDTY